MSQKRSEIEINVMCSLSFIFSSLIVTRIFFKQISTLFCPKQHADMSAEEKLYFVMLSLFASV